MPKLGNEWIGAVAYLFGSVTDAERSQIEDDPSWPQKPGELGASAASGCLIDFHHRRTVHQYIVTNRHVVKEGLAVPRLSLSDGSTCVLDVVEDNWFCNIIDTDLAILPVPRTCSAKIKGISYSEDWGYARPAFLSDPPYGVHVGDDVAMAGRFYPVSGGAHNRPVVRFGNIAQWPARPMRLPWFDREMEALLVEMRSHSGYSGSPAFVFGGLTDHANRTMRQIIDDLGRDRIFPEEMELDWREVKFLGVDCGHLQGNMAVVIPWFKVTQLLLSETLANLRREAESQLPPNVTGD